MLQPGPHFYSFSYYSCSDKLIAEISKHGDITVGGHVGQGDRSSYGYIGLVKF